jgi:glycolate oxidase
MIDQSTLQRIKTIVGADNYFDSPEDRIAYSYDGTPMLQQLPDAAVRPRSVEHISHILRLANEAGFAVIPRGSGSGLSGGSVPVENSVVLLMNGWNRVLELDKRNFCAWVEPGVITGDFHTIVEAQGYLYPPDPGSAAISTLGGNIAENAGGLRGLKYGVTKNYVMGLEVVLPDGQVVILGGKNVKDVAGYNLKDFLIGSEGTLGVITKALLKLIPKPETSKTMLAFFPKLTDSSEAVAGIIAAKILPATLEFLDQTTIRCVEDYAKLGLPTDIEALLLIEVDGRKGPVEEDALKVVDICKIFHASEVKIAANVQEATKLRMARKIAFSSLARVKPTTILEDATVPTSEVPLMCEKVIQLASKYDLAWGNFGHAGDGNLHPTCLTDERDKKEIHRAELALDDLFTFAVKLGGTITGEHGVGLAKKQFFEKLAPPPMIDMMRKIKMTMDPNNVLNPTKIFSLKPRCEGILPRDSKQLKKLLDAGAYV